MTNLHHNLPPLYCAFPGNLYTLKILFCLQLRMVCKARALAIWKVTQFFWGSSMYVCMFAQSHPTLCDPMDCSLLGSSVRGIFQARKLEWAAILFFRGSSQPGDRIQVSCILQVDYLLLSRRESPMLYIFYHNKKNH